MVAKYEVLQKTFIAPHTLHPGSIIETPMEPGDHFRPLNAEAEAAMEKWYEKPYETKDKDGKVVSTDFPNRIKRPVESSISEAQPGVTLVKAAPDPNLQLLDNPLSQELQPDLVPTEQDSAVQENLETFDGETNIVAAAPESKTKDK